MRDEIRTAGKQNDLSIAEFRIFQHLLQQFRLFSILCNPFGAVINENMAAAPSLRPAMFKMAHQVADTLLIGSGEGCDELRA